MKWLPAVASSALFVLSCGFLYVRLTTSREIVSDLTALPADIEPEHHFRSENDPHIGAKVTRFAIPTSSHATKPVLVVVGGSCSSCSLHAFDPASVDARAYSKVALIYQTTPEMVPQSLKKIGKPFEVILDPTGNLTNSLNGVWYPRFYEFSPAGRLIALQEHSGKQVGFLHLRS